MSFTSKIYGNCIIPLSYYLRGDLRFWYFNQYTKNLRKSKREIKIYQLERLRKLVSHAYETVPYYTELFDKLNLKPEDIKSISDLIKIPVLDKSTIRNNLDKLKSNKKYTLKESSSSGSTGNRIVIFKDKRYEEISRAVFMRNLWSVGVEPGEKVAWIWSSPIENAKLKKNLLHRIFWHLNRRILFNPLVYTDKQLEDWIRNDFTRFKPKYIYGYPNLIYDMAKLIKKKNIPLPHIKKIICSAQHLEHREFIEDVFRCKVIDQYGSREILSISIEDDNYIMHSSDDFVIVELGKDNEIILTPLESYGMPLMRYVIGDMGLKQNYKKQDNHPFNQFNLKIGRLFEVLRNTKGEKITSSKINLQIAKEKLRIGEYQIVQKSLKEVQLNVVKDARTSGKDVARLVQIIKQALGSKIVVVSYLKKFPLEKSGKKIGYKCLIKEVE